MPETLETKMNDDNHSDLEFETWGALFRTVIRGEYSLKKNRNSSFSGSVRTRCVSGLTAVEIGCNNSGGERTPQDIRRDEVDYFKLDLSLSGHATFSQNDRQTECVAGSCLLVDMRRPFSYAIGEQQLGQVALVLPRRLLTSTIGFEPEGGLSWRSDSLAVRLLSRLILDAQGDEAGGAAAEHHMQRAICDLLGALMASNDLLSYSSHREKMFGRITDIVKHHFTDPNIGPRDLATEAGISLRHLQKFFTARGTTCSRYILSLRLDNAVRLMHLRSLTTAPQPLTEVAYASGFQDYRHFSRVFRSRFGHSPNRYLSRAAEERSDDNSPSPDR